MSKVSTLEAKVDLIIDLNEQPIDSEVGGEDPFEDVPDFREHRNGRAQCTPCSMAKYGGGFYMLAAFAFACICGIHIFLCDGSITGYCNNNLAVYGIWFFDFVCGASFVAGTICFLIGMCLCCCEACQHTHHGDVYKVDNRYRRQNYTYNTTHHAPAPPAQNHHHHHNNIRVGYNN